MEQIRCGITVLYMYVHVEFATLLYLMAWAYVCTIRFRKYEHHSNHECYSIFDILLGSYVNDE